MNIKNINATPTYFFVTNMCYPHSGQDLEDKLVEIGFSNTNKYHIVVFAGRISYDTEGIKSFIDKLIEYDRNKKLILIRPKEDDTLLWLDSYQREWLESFPYRHKGDDFYLSNGNYPCDVDINNFNSYADQFDKPLFIAGSNGFWKEEAINYDSFAYRKGVFEISPNPHDTNFFKWTSNSPFNTKDIDTYYNVVEDALKLYIDKLTEDPMIVVYHNPAFDWVYIKDNRKKELYRLKTKTFVIKKMVLKPWKWYKGTKNLAKVSMFTRSYYVDMDSFEIYFNVDHAHDGEGDEWKERMDALGKSLRKGYYEKRK